MQFGNSVDCQVNDFVMKSGLALMNISSLETLALMNIFNLGTLVFMYIFNFWTAQELLYAAEVILAKIEDFRRSNGRPLSDGQKAMARDVIFRAKALCYKTGTPYTRIDYYDGLMFSQ